VTGAGQMWMLPLDGFSLLLLSVVVFAAAFVQGATGVGFALITAPVIGIFKPELLPVCLLVLMLPLNAFVAWRERSFIDRTGAGWITGARLLGTFAGLWVLVVLSVSQLALFVGISTIAAALVTLAMPVFAPGRKAFVATGLITGVTETATGIGGPPLALVYQHHPAQVMRSTIAVCFLAGEVISLVVLLAADRVHAAQLLAAALLLPALAAGVVLSRLAHRYFNGKLLRWFVQCFAIASSVVLIWRA